MAYSVFHIELDDGSDYESRFQAVDYSTGLARDLTGFRAELQARVSLTSQPVLNLNTEVDGGIILGGIYGTIDVIIKSSKLISNLWEFGSYDLFLYSPTGGREKFLKGFITLKNSNSRLPDSTLTDISLGVTPPLPHPNNLDAGAMEKP